MTIAPSKPIAEIIDTNRYCLVRKIADGGMGSVYEAILHGAEGFQKVVAVKTILEEYSSNPEFIGMFIGEAKLVADLVHQNIVQIYQLGRFGRLYYMAMEYIKGVNLQQFIERHRQIERKVPVDLGVFIISRICRGLEYAHKKRDKDGNFLGVVHRDISPKNLMISSEGEVKITDFGIAKASNLMADREGEVLLGKIRYMSPEQFELAPTDRRSDLYSLAVVMYELLTGTGLYSSGDRQTIFKERRQGVVHAPRDINMDIPEAAERIILKGLQYDVSDRYQKASEMAYDLEYFLYHKGYGPTIRTLEEYMSSLFPTIYVPESDEPDTDPEGKTS